MLTRTLTIKFQDGFETTIMLPNTSPDTSVGELHSAQEFVNEVIRYKSAFQRFMARAPKLTTGAKTKHYPDLGSVFNVIVNARKFIDIPSTMFLGDQHFSMDMTTGTFTLYRVDNQEERGTMSIGLIYSNWKELFYSDCIDMVLTEHIIKEEATAEHTESKLDELIKPESEYFNPHTEKMKEHLDTYAFNLWKHFFEERHYAEESKSVEHVMIEYSGSGDSGSTEYVTLKLEDGTEKNIELTRELDDLIWTLISSREAGFYNNEGGRGDMELTNTTFNWDHYNYIQEEDHSVNMVVALDKTEEYPGIKEDDDDEKFFDYEIELIDSDEEDDEHDEDDEDEEHYDEIEADDLRHSPED